MTAKLSWLDSHQEKFTYLFAQAFGNCVAEAYRHQQQQSEDLIDPVLFVAEQAERAIEHLKKVRHHNEPNLDI